MSDKEELVAIFTLNTPKCFDPKEIRNFEDYLAQQAETSSNDLAIGLQVFR
jgi:hypothetical protein